MNRGRVRLLLVEHSEKDAELVLKELKQQGFIADHRRVDNRANLLAALRDESWDAIISDYSLPQFSGPEALKCVRQLNFNLPFIMVSGIYGEEAAVEALRAGANDHIMKGNISRLAPALERELAASEERRHRQRAEGASRFLASIVESSEDAIYGKNLDSIIVSWNPAAEKLYGHSAEEIIGKSITRLFPTNRGNELLEVLAACRRGEIVRLHDTERLHKSGRSVNVSVIISPIKAANGEIIGASAIARDITLQKQAELERQRLIASLTAKANEVRRLTGMLPICAACKSIRNDKGYWQKVEAYIAEHSDAVFSHGLCPECLEKFKQESSLFPG